MKIVVCVRFGLDGELNPFDACAYEEALRIKGAEVTLLSMGPRSTENALHALTRLGARHAILLSDSAFAGADTLATAYALSKAVKKIDPDLIFCGRQTLVGDTAQTGPMLATLGGASLITNVMKIEALDSRTVRCQTRDEGEACVNLPALLTVERINTLRLPRLRSAMGDISVWSAADIDADTACCGLGGSPTKVVRTFENETGRRRCRLITREELDGAIRAGLEKSREAAKPEASSDGKTLPLVCIVGEAPRAFAETLAREIAALAPDAVLWGSDAKSKRLAACTAAKLSLGLCADCTRLETDGKTLWMYRPALSGSIIAKIISTTRPAMATVRTDSRCQKNILVGAGFGVRAEMERIRAFADSLDAEVVTTRKMTDNAIAPYELQVGLTGKTVAPPVYIAVGISGAIHHVAGMQRAGTVIAINPDKNAPIFDYADYGIVEEF